MGIPNNETADLLAKDSISNTSTTLIKKITLLEAITWLKSTFLKIPVYILERMVYSSSTNFAILHPNIPKNHWHDNMHFDRNSYTTLFRLMFNHGRFPSHFFKIGIFDSPMCIQCNLEEGTTNYPTQPIKFSSSSSFHDGGANPGIQGMHLSGVSPPHINIIKKIQGRTGCMFGGGGHWGPGGVVPCVIRNPPKAGFSAGISMKNERGTMKPSKHSFCLC